MSETTNQDPQIPGRRERWSWTASEVWTERMLAALENGVKGGKWFALIDKVYAPQTLRGAWEQVRRNQGAAGGR